MATLILGAVGAAIGGAATLFSVAGTAITGSMLLGAAGTALGSILDAAIVQSLMPGQRVEGARLESLRVTSATEGAVIPRLFGRMRMGGNIIWATDFTEQSTTSRQGGKGGGGGVKTTTYTYSTSFAVALCEGAIAGIGRMWADGKPIDLTGVTYRVYLGTETQDADPLIVSKMGAEKTPAYRGTAYVVFENLDLEPFGNRIPQITFEVFAPVVDQIGAEGMIKAVGLLTGTGEFALATAVVTQKEGGATSSVNCHAFADTADLVISLDNLESLVPAADSVTIPPAWFGDDLRAGVITIRPKVESASRVTTPAWACDGIARGAAAVLSEVADLPAFGGTPSDGALVQAITELGARGKRVTVAPSILLDIAGSNTLPNPYSNNAATNGQPAYPPRGLITPSPALGFTGAVDGAAGVTSQVAAFFGAAAASDFNVSGTTVTWTGSPTEWGYRRLVLHYAKLCAAAGGVDAFLIGSGLAALTRARNNAGAYPAVTALATLAADVALILPSAQIGYAADWTEYNGRDRGSGNFDFNLDPLWSAAAIDFVGINFYAPLSDWRDGTGHIDAEDFASIYEPAYLEGNVTGGEYFDWRYASPADRASQTRTLITDAGIGKPWMFRQKDIRSWWASQHKPRAGGVEGAATAWVPESKPIRLTEVGCPAIDRGTNQPAAYRDQKSGSAALPYWSRGYRDDAAQRAYLTAVLGFFADPANNPDSSEYGDPMVDLTECAAWGWDARPNPAFPEITGVWGDDGNWETGLWLTGRIGSSGVGSIVRALCLSVGMTDDQLVLTGLVGAAEGFAITAIESPRTSIAILMRHFGFDATESGGQVKFVQRGRLPSITLTAEDFIASEDALAEPFELMRAQTTDLPQILKWNVIRSDEDYDPAPVEARRSTAASARTVLESFPLAVPPEEAQRRVDRALLEIWVGIESMMGALPPSRMALDATDVVLFQHDGRSREYRIVSISEDASRRIETTMQDRFAYDRRPGPPREASLPAPVTYGEPDVIFLNLPQLASGTPDYQPYIVADSTPWPGSLSVEKSPVDSGYLYLTGINRRASFATLAADFAAGPLGLWDDGSECIIDLTYGTLGSVEDILVLQGQNAFAVETAAGVWEIFQAANVELVSPGRYKLTRLLRGQKGTEYAMADPAPEGARVIVLNLAVTPLPIESTEVGLTLQWIVGPSIKPISDPSWHQEEFTPSGAGLRPFSPVITAEPRDTPRATGDYTISWTRRDRSLDADAWADGEVPMSEASEKYAVEIYLGPTLKRTLTVTEPEALYLAADQVTDLGALLDIGDTLDIRVYQISARVGRGIPLIHTLLF